MDTPNRGVELRPSICPSFQRHPDRWKSLATKSWSSSWVLIFIASLLVCLFVSCWQMKFGWLFFTASCCGYKMVFCCAQVVLGGSTVVVGRVLSVWNADVAGRVANSVASNRPDLQSVTTKVKNGKKVPSASPKATLKNFNKFHHFELLVDCFSEIWMFPKIVGFPHKSSISIGFFHYKPSILGHPYFWKHSYHVL